MGVFSFDSDGSESCCGSFTPKASSTSTSSSDSPPGRLVLTTEAIENIPAGWRARETYVFTGSDQVEEIFELAEPGKDFAAYSRNRLTRVR